MTDEPLRLLVVCTANQCRSPLGEVIARDQLRRRGVTAVVLSAGTQAVAGAPATESAVATADRLGLDLSAHESRPLDDRVVAGADLIVAMEGRHVVELTTTHGAELGRTFTLPELARLAAATPSHPGERLGEWLSRLNEGRDVITLLGGGRGVAEIDDPIGRSMRHYRGAAAEISAAFATLFDAWFGLAGGGDR